MGTFGRRGPYKDGFVKISGYLYQYMPDHPNCTYHGYMAVHRLVVENKIGRLLLSSEHIHHIDQNKLNNDPENLMVLSKSEHQSIHMKMRMALKPKIVKVKISKKKIKKRTIFITTRRTA